MVQPVSFAVQKKMTKQLLFLHVTHPLAILHIDLLLQARIDLE